MRIVPSNGIMICGASFESGNRGVSALASSVVTLLSTEVCPGESITLFHPSNEIDPPVASAERGGADVRTMTYWFRRLAPLRRNALSLLIGAVVYRLTPITPVRRFLRRKLDVLDAMLSVRAVAEIWGGDSFSDIYGRSLFLKTSLGSVLACILDRPLWLLPQTYGPYQSRLVRFLARRIISHAEVVLTRSRSHRWVEMLRLDQRVVREFCPDVAFLLAPARSDYVDELVQATGDAAGPYGINVSGLLYYGGYSRDNTFGLAMDYRRFVLDLAGMILKDFGRSIVFVPHTYSTDGSAGERENDLGAAKSVIAELGISSHPGVSVIARDLDHHEIKYAIGKTGFFVGSRLHACIGALSQGIPAVGVAYSDKFIDVFGSIGLSDLVVDARAVSEDTAIVTIRRLMSAHDLAERVRTSAAVVERNIRDCFSALNGLH